MIQEILIDCLANILLSIFINQMSILQFKPISRIKMVLKNLFYLMIKLDKFKKIYKLKKILINYGLKILK